MARANPNRHETPIAHTSSTADEGEATRPTKRFGAAFHMYLGRFCCVGLPIVTSEGLAGRLQWRAISPLMKAHKSPLRDTRDIGLRANASRNVSIFGSGLSVGRTGTLPGGGDIFRGPGDNLKNKTYCLKNSTCRDVWESGEFCQVVEMFTRFWRKQVKTRTGGS